MGLFSIIYLAGVLAAILYGFSCVIRFLRDIDDDSIGMTFLYLACYFYAVFCSLLSWVSLILMIRYWYKNFKEL